jgi:hypothetical protein
VRARENIFSDVAEECEGDGRAGEVGIDELVLLF